MGTSGSQGPCEQAKGLSLHPTVLTATCRSSREPLCSIELGTFVCCRRQASPWPPGLHTPGALGMQKGWGWEVVLKLHPAMH